MRMTAAIDEYVAAMYARRPSPHLGRAADVLDDYIIDTLEGRLVFHVPVFAQGGVVVAHALVDAADVATISPYRWHRNPSTGYVLRCEKQGGRRAHIKLHHQSPMPDSASRPELEEKVLDAAVNAFMKATAITAAPVRYRYDVEEGMRAALSVIAEQLGAEGGDRMNDLNVLAEEYRKGYAAGKEDALQERDEPKSSLENLCGGLVGATELGERHHAAERLRRRQDDPATQERSLGAWREDEPVSRPELEAQVIAAMRSERTRCRREYSGGEPTDLELARAVITAYEASSSAGSTELGERDGELERPQLTAEEYDASNAVRLCDRCEGEQGVAAGADKGDRACSACGQHDAPHIYPALAHRDVGETGG